MNRILIHKKIIPYGDYDLKYIDDINKVRESVKLNYNGECPNYGNKLWLGAIISEISTPENEITFINDEMTPDYINNNFDMIILPMANIFNKDFLPFIKSLTDFYKNIKIPTFITACGVQCDEYDALDKLISEIQDQSKDFIETIYKTGGEFALRGYFTKEFFTKLGYNTAVVTGCPSMYQFGRDFKLLEKKKVSESEFKPILNGIIYSYDNCTRILPNAVYIDQENSYDFLYNTDFFKNMGFDRNDLKSLVKKYSYPRVELASNDKIRLFYNINDWRNYIIENDFNFSFGTKIHGTIMAVLSGVPAMLRCCDTRTREMAEFFNIPSCTMKAVNLRKLYDVYLNTDYTEFNRTFAEKYDNFEKFLTDNKIVKKANPNNIFFDETKPAVIENPNKNELAKLKKVFDDNRNYINTYYNILKLYRKIRKI